VEVVNVEVVNVEIDATAVEIAVSFKAVVIVMMNVVLSVKK
jgi:acetylglutamate kinase